MCPCDVLVDFGCHKMLGKLARLKGNYKVIHGLSAGVGKAEIQPSGRSVHCDTWAMCWS